MPGTADVVAVRGPASAVAQALDRLWGQAAVLPLDPRLPDLQARRLLGALKPTALWDGDEALGLEGGLPVAEEVAAVVPTSGTTGTPKGVEMTYDALQAAAVAVHARLGVRPGERWACCLPVSHLAGFATLVRSRLLGTPPVILDRFDPSTIARADASLLPVVPTMLARLLDAGVDLARYRWVVVGGAALEPDLRRRAEDAGCRLVETYGATETGGGVVYDGIPLDGVRVWLRTDARILVSGPTLMRGYRRRADLMDAVLRDGWLVTSDVGKIDAEGRLRVLGRADEAITTGGEMVFPEEVERILRAHPGIADAAVFALPDDEWGQLVAAAIVPVSGARPHLEDLCDFVSQHSPRFKAPRRLFLVTKIPRLAIGKPARRSLRDRFATVRHEA